MLYGGSPDWVATLAAVRRCYVMIEKRQAVEDLDAILDVPGRRHGAVRAG